MTDDGTRAGSAASARFLLLSDVADEKFVLSANSLDELVGLGTITPQAALPRVRNHRWAQRHRRRRHPGGKITLLNCFASTIPGRERVITCEEVIELANPAA